ncbi:MAG: ABC transporter permease, partial [Lachnospiraceae bacterium]|nr:ABC transporter permease [Lachnospiraceae bacterium]
FAGEWHNNTSSLLLTMKNGWHKVAYAKAGSGIAFAAELFAMLTVGSVAAQLFYLGTSGWNMPIQNIKMIAVAPMNMLQAEIYEYAYLFLGMIGYAGVVILISASVKSNVLALLLSFAVAYAPMVIERYLPYGVQKALDLIPLSGSSADIFRTNTFHIFGKYIWSPYLLITVPVFIGIICVPFAVKGWARRMRI